MKTSSLSIIGRNVTNAYYDFQQVRIASMNRVRDVIRKLVEGIKFDEVETKKETKKYKKKYTDKELIAMLDKLLIDHKILTEEHDYIMECWEIMKEAKKLEKKFQNAMKTFISKEAVYNEFLSKIRGIAEILSANLIKEFGDCRVMIYSIEKEDCRAEDGTKLVSKLIAKEGDADFEKYYLLAKGDSVRYKIKGYPNVSKLWAHSGNSVVNGLAPKLRKGKTLSFSPRLRTLTWKLSDSLMKQNKGVYRDIYLKEKERQLGITYDIGVLEEKYGKPYKKEDINISLGHAHNRALRKMRKIFLDHYWCASRELNGLSTEKNYVEGVLGHTHIITWREAIAKEGMLVKPDGT